jgi:MoxR-like ATPase
VALELLAIRGQVDAAGGYAETIWDAMLLALSGRIHGDEAVDETPETVLRKIWEDRFVLDPRAAAPG